MIVIDYERLADAISFYKTRGYEYVETPWIVSQDVKRVTFGGDKELCDLGYLVGSAEQGFIELILSDKLREGDYVSAGPCFRFDDRGQPNKHPYFFKVELCRVGTTSYNKLIRDAHNYLGGEIIQTHEGHDIEFDGVEIGSYGSRRIRDRVWSYGTGLAEPRYSECCNRRKNRINDNAGLALAAIEEQNKRKLFNDD